MTPERWQQIRAVFDSAVELPPSEIDPFLKRTCGDDAELYSDVRHMVNEHQRTGLLDRTPLALATAPAGSPPVFQPGQLVSGRYRIVRYLSRGGMGEVYQAQDLELSGPVALKTLLPAIADDEVMIARFKQEIALSRKVAHPNVCKVYDLDKHEENGQRPVVFLSMEFLDGETLAAKLQRDGPMTPADALPILRQTGEALDAAHRAGVIHRDLKPSNVMLAPADGGVRAVVTDFGLARSFVSGSGTTATISNMLVGTLDYMAPELLTGSPATFSSDVYALGMMAYKMVTGTLPFACDTPLAGAILRSKQSVPSPRTLAPAIDERWERAILRAVDPDPGKRFSQARHFLQALSGDAVSITVKRPVMTRRWAVKALLVAAVLIAAIVGWNAWQDARNRPSPEALALYRKGVEDISAGAYFAASKALEQATQLAPHDAQIHARLAEAYVEMDMPDKAGVEMLLVKRQNLSRLPKAARLQIEGIDLEITHEYRAAAAKFEEMARASGGGADVALDLGRIYEKASRMDDAVKSYRQAAEGPEHSPAAWLRLGILYARQSNDAKSTDAFSRAEQGYQLTSNLEGLTEVAIQQGIAGNSRGKLVAAAAFLKKALETARLAGNFQQEVNATLRLSTNAYLSGDAAATESYAREALEIARSHQLSAVEVRSMMGLGNALRRKQDTAAAEKEYKDALDLARQNHSGQLTASALVALATLHSETHRREEAVKEAQEALSFYQANKYEKESLQCLTVLARARRDAGDQAGAMATFRDLIRIAESANDRANATLGHEGVGSILFKQDRFPEALQEFQQNLLLAPDAEHTGYANEQCGNQLWRLGRFPEAISMYAKADEAAVKFLPLRSQLMYHRSCMFLSQNQFREAADMAHRALALLPEKDIETHAQLDRVLALAMLATGSKTEALKLAEKSWTALQGLSSADELLLSRVAVLQARLATGDRQSAFDIFQEIDGQLSGKPELRFRTLALLAGVDSKYRAVASDALNHLSQLWGDSALKTYLTRPDVDKLSRHLFHSIPAIH